MYILGINISHHPSSCLIKDGEIVYYVEHERDIKIKNYTFQEHLNGHYENILDDELYYPGIDILKKHTDILDYVIFTSYGQEEIDGDIIKILGKNLDDNDIKYKTKLFFHENHHIYHASTAFYSSGFENAVALVMDGGGSYDKEYYYNNLKEKYKYPFRETESIYNFSYGEITPIFKHYSYLEHNVEEIFIVNKEKPYKEFFTHSFSCGNYYSLLVELFGTGDASQGKIMGLSSHFNEEVYKNPLYFEEWFYELNGEWVSKTCPFEFVQNIMNKLNLEICPNFNNFNPKKILKESNYYVDINEQNDLKNKFKNYANIAKKCQIETEKQTIRLIQKALDLSGSKNIVLSGGYFLNCVNNFKYLEHFPGINFYIDPMSNDGGTSIGAALWLYHGLTEDKTIRPLKNLYLGRDVKSN